MREPQIHDSLYPDTKIDGLIGVYSYQTHTKYLSSNQIARQPTNIQKTPQGEGAKSKTAFLRKTRSRAAAIGKPSHVRGSTKRKRTFQSRDSPSTSPPPSV
ncbi:hypothetical protein CEXT_561721 [Caerostris extrusa]|uniref:Uncharacterized protein n=1 Tax=Caerostris extrusa TaxID=172846 RepID=A0AAV4RWY4_CAEEX|nr:hypothetical protein CEXT_561721 [Caerostris extrusa]